MKYDQVPSVPAKIKSHAERDRLINEYAPLVKTIAGRLAIRLPQHISQDDLHSAGIMGLLDAIEKFDEGKGVKFKSYAEFRIRGAMIDELRSMDWVPRSVRKNAKKLEQAYSKVEHVKMRRARDEEVAEEMEVDLKTFHKLLDETRGISIINEYEIVNNLPKEGVDILGILNLDGGPSNPLDSLKLTEIREVLAQAIESLPKNERIVIALYYYEELTMKEIGTVMGYTESRISQLHTKAVIRLRNSLKGYFNQ